MYLKQLAKTIRENPRISKMFVPNSKPCIFKVSTLRGLAVNRKNGGMGALGITKKKLK